MGKPRKNTLAKGMHTGVVAAVASTDKSNGIGNPPARTASGSNGNGSNALPSNGKSNGKSSGVLGSAGPRPASGIAQVTVKAASDGIRKRVAVVGSGIAGHSAAYYMRAAHDVTLLEADEKRAGGHAWAMAIPGAPGVSVDVGFQDMYEIILKKKEIQGAPGVSVDVGFQSYRAWVCGRMAVEALLFRPIPGAPGVSVNVGFQVMNLSNYPLLTRLFDELGVLTIASDMSLSASVTPPGGGAPFEWSSKSPFPSVGAWLDPARWVLFAGILWFESDARAYLATARDSSVEAQNAAAAQNEEEMCTNVQQWLDKRGYSQSFRVLYFYPMVASIWSAPKEGVDGFSMLAVLAFLDNHFMLQRQRPRWRTPKHRSQDYVAKLHATLPEGAVVMGAKVAAILKAADGSMTLLDAAGNKLAGGKSFDAGTALPA
ncbi:hypothetical protein T492DRAFT_840126 [Pavlovales sp. CCMP2436]|nr:hypothetical protein T492DRAFT_840126 [Pavlovales sp. CCMP2436]